MKINLKTRIITVLFSTLVILTGCAQKGNPGGGEGDVTPPLFINSKPEAETVNHPVSEPVVMRFNEWIEPGSAEKAITLHPTLPGGFEIKTYAKKVQIIPNDSFARNTTYHILINSEISDFYKNKMKEPVPLVFSTGEQIDSGVITGAAILENDDTDTPLKVALFKAARLDTTLDTTYFGEADYYSQCDSLGQFSFTNINEGTYGIVAYRDKDGDNRLTPGEMAFIGEKELVSTDTPVTHMLSRVSSDTTWGDVKKPLFISATLMKSSVEPKGVIPETLTITRKDSTEKSVTFKPKSLKLLRDSSTLITEFKDSIPSGQYTMITTYKNRFKAGANLPKNDTLPFSAIRKDTLLFNAITAGDTSLPKLINWSVRRRNTPQPQLVLNWSTPVVFEGELFLSDTLGNKFPMSVSEMPELELVISPKSALPLETEMTLAVNFSHFTSPTGVVGETVDTSFTFTTVADKDVALSLLLTNSNCPTEDNWQWELAPVKKGEPILMNRTDQGQLCEQFPAGLYTVSLFDDKNGNGKQEMGTLFPRLPGENRIFIADTVKAKGRWRTELVLESPCDLQRRETVIPEEDSTAEVTAE